MSQLKHRISIGKVVDGKWKHDHYATEHELTYLKAHTDGKIYMRSVTNRWAQEGFIYDSPYCSTISLFSGWQDVSDTHRVEWGDTFEDSGDIYENDILRVSTGDSFIDMIVSFERGTFRLHNIDWTEHETMQDMDGYKPISNTHIYPNFLEVT